MKKRAVYCMAVILLLVLAGCGRQEETGSLPQGSGNPGTSEPSSAGTEAAAVPVAEYRQMWLPVAARNLECFEMDQGWLYFGEERSKYAADPTLDIYRNGIFDGYDPKLYLSIPAEVIPSAYVPDKKGGLFLYGQEESGQESGVFFLEKYDEEGILQWHRDYEEEELAGAGARLKAGSAAPEGGVLLYARGEGGIVADMDSEGNVREMYVPKMDRLEGVAVTEEGTAYVYGYAGGSQVFEEVGGDGESLRAPIGFQSAFGGKGGSICLYTSKGLWEFTPDTSNNILLWNWSDEYVQLDGSGVEAVCYCYDGYYVMGREWTDRNTPLWKEGEPLSLARVSFQDAGEYPGKETVTVARAWGSGDFNSRMEDMVRLYNRQSREYVVKLVSYHEGQAGTAALSRLEQELLRGEGPDLIELNEIYVPYMAKRGMLEDLTGYYEASNVVGLEDLMPEVREAGAIADKNVLVIPSFYIRSWISKEPVAMEEWTIWRFLELAGERQMMPSSDPYTAYAYCRELNALERFVDYETGESHFDSPEFVRLLEECAKVPAREVPEVTYSGDYVDAEYLLMRWEIFDMEWYITMERWFGDNAAYQGVPGWEGAQHGLCPMDVFGMNKESKNKEGAWDFLEFLLSREAQDAIDWGFPARSDSFEGYLERSYVHREYAEGSDVPQPEDFQAVKDMVSASVYTSVTQMRDVVRSIVDEEVRMFFDGGSGVDETVKKIQNRVSLYLQEM